MAVGTATTLPAISAQAQTATNIPASEGEQEIVVTAQFREERLIDVPLSITSLDGETLQRQGASAIEDVQSTVPGLAITQFSPGQQRVTLRGISVFSGSPTVGTYLDELPLNNEISQTGLDVRLLDIQRIEVLRGPQGTLYGQGSLGGTIRYITNPVDLAGFAASASAEGGLVDSGGTDWKAEGMVNVPLVTDRVGVRLAGSFQHFGGWIDNPVLGDENVNSGDALALRARLRFAVTDRFEISVLAQHQDLDLGAANLSDGNQRVFDEVPTFVRSRATLLNAVATYDLGGVTLLSSTGFVRRRNRQQLDFTQTLEPVLQAILGLPPGAFQFISSNGRSSNDIFTQEVRLTSDGAGPFQWTIGGFYRDSSGRAVSTSQATPDLLPPGFVVLAAEGRNPEDSQSWAVYGEASYAITASLSALVGLRYFEDERTQDSRSTVFNSTAVDQARETFNSLSPRFNLSWQPDRNLNFYVNVAKGFRSGGFNLTSSGLGIVPIPQSYAPETLWSYEAGGKFQSSDRRLSAELAVYRNEWSNVQSLAFALGLPVSYTVNGGELAGYGVDATLSFTPVPAFTMTLTAGWNDVDYVSSTAEHLPGDPADYVPSFTGSASAEYRFEIGTLPAFARIDYQYSDRFQVFVRTFQTVPAVSDAQHVLNARIGVNGARWGAALFARNLLNRDSIIYPAFGSLIYPSRLQPRVIGVSLSFNY